MGKMAKYTNEVDGQADFFKQFRIDADRALILNTDGVWNGCILEFKVAINDVNQVLFQAVKYLARLRLNARNVPANILLVDLNAACVYVFRTEDYFEDIHQPYALAASRDNHGFVVRTTPFVIADYDGAGAQDVVDLLASREYVPIRITEDCVVPWAERFYREVLGSDKADFLNYDLDYGPLGELKDPKHFKGLILPYEGANYERFSQILDQLNDRLKKIELGSYYTPQPYVDLSHQLLRQAIARVPGGNDYVIVDRCAGTGNLERGLTEEELSHVIVNTYEQFEYLELQREYAGRVRAIIPPTYAAGDPSQGMLRNGDALSESFVHGVEGSNGKRRPNVIQEHVDDPNCTIILFENPPYADSSSMEAQNESVRLGGRSSFGWVSSYVREQMEKAVGPSANNSIPTKEVANVFIWSAFEYYLRQPTDSYVVFSPAKYFNQHHLVTKKFLAGYLVNRKHFHARKASGVTIVLWSNEDEPGRTEYPLEIWDIDKSGQLFPGAVKSGWEAAGNVELRDGEAPVVTLKHVTKRLSTLFDKRREPNEVPGIASAFDGYEVQRKVAITLRDSPNLIGFLVAEKMSFDQTDLATMLTRVAVYNGTGGFYLHRDNYLTKLPLFAVGRYPSEGRFWVRGVVNRNADAGDNFSHDRDFLKACLIYTGLAYHNKCRSFLGSNGVTYLNEICFDEGTQASKDLATYTLDGRDRALLAQWQKVLSAAKQTAEYRADRMYGTYQIAKELNTSHSEVVGKKKATIYDYPLLNGEYRTLRTMTARYFDEAIAPSLWKYGLLK